MKTMLFKKTILSALIAALVLAALPLTGVSAAGQTDPIPPAQRNGQSRHLAGLRRTGRLRRRESDRGHVRRDCGDGKVKSKMKVRRTPNQGEQL